MKPDLNEPKRMLHQYRSFVGMLEDQKPNFYPKEGTFGKIRVSVTKLPSKEIVVIFTFTDLGKALTHVCDDQDDMISFLAMLTVDVVEQYCIERFAEQIHSVTHVLPSITNG